MSANDYISSGIVEQYVLGLCSPADQLELEQFRKTDAVLNEAIIHFEIQFEKVMMGYSSLPDAVTNDHILAKINELSNSPVISIKREEAYKNRYRWIKLAAAAAILLLGTSASFNYLLYNKNKSQSDQLAIYNNNKVPGSLPVADFNILKDPSITPVAMYGVGYHSICRCTMFWDKRSGKVYIMIHHLPLSDDKSDYQLWANVNGKQVSVGIVNDAIRDRFIEMSNMPSDATTFTVTLEKSGGATVPTIDEIYLKGTI